MTSGIIFLNKPPGVTSFQALGTLKRQLGHKKIGHTGTLDKFAQGLMVVLAGGFTRLNPFFTDLGKTYTGTFRFGAETDTLDPEGRIVQTKPVPNLTEIEKLLPKFTGSQLQTPPLYSAIHINGNRAYKLARAGEQPVLEPRKIEIYSMEILKWNSPT